MRLDGSTARRENTANMPRRIGAIRPPRPGNAVLALEHLRPTLRLSASLLAISAIKTVHVISRRPYELTKKLEFGAD